jgi:hypothetical protein
MVHMPSILGQALINRERIGVSSEHWPLLLPLRAEIKRFVRTMATHHSAIVRGGRLFGHGIHVSPVSSAWLRVHETEHAKHGVDF